MNELVKQGMSIIMISSELPEIINMSDRIYVMNEGRVTGLSLIHILEALAKENGFHLPPFCSWTPEEWDEKGHECDEIRDNKLGWDITDYGLGRFDELGFALVTIRNGNLKDPKYKKPYAEKLLMLYPGQDSQMCIRDRNY